MWPHLPPGQSFRGRYKASFLPPESKARLKDFKPLFLGELTSEMEQRRKLRPLLDEVLKAGG